MQVRYDITPSEHLEMVRAVRVNSARRVARVCLGLLGFFLAILSIHYVDAALGIVTAAIFAMFTTTPFLLPFIIHRRISRRNLRLFSVRTVTFDDHGVTSDSEMGRVERRWSAFESYRETKNLFLTFQTKDSVGIVPKRAFPEPEMIAEFRALLASKIGRGTT